ncbi:LLM class flavin-dependent oxidoreductase [Sporosarcina sp. ACRSL]|uniref:LLM class flavin-dependent oxidoreductase n=1 Tax=Sporosarcina sp. ACRSL TaxID=2918215 RepID=UPI001EF57C7F|nr:LLM class flavin-dependent oxidoreductase [Sporosarcina sp. ACRSL]MCG7344965.1 LLM class flavin-dependent oxidoreductase [Sporosarcina sp. ACRSL]
MAYKLGILDQSPIFPGSTATHALKQTIHLAQKAEAWGYKRFWVSEHHDTDQLAGSSPEILMSHLLAKTNSIRVGSGGVMLQHYSPYKIVENFHLLSSLAPGRVDLGIGKAPGGLPLSTKALQIGNVQSEITFEDRIILLNKFLDNSLEDGHPLANVQATPIPPEKTENYLLGASPASAKLAADIGWNFVYAHFINSDLGVLEEAAQVYHAESESGRFIVAAAVFAAPTQQEAEQTAKDRKIYKVHLESGRSVTVVSEESAKTFGEQAGEPYRVTEHASNIIAGTPSFIQGKLKEWHQAYEVDEFIFHTPIEDEEVRFRSFQLLSPEYSNVERKETVNVQ